MKFAIVSDVIGLDGKTQAVVPIVGSDLEAQVLTRLRAKVRFVGLRSELEKALHAAFVEEEAAVRQATYALGPQHQ